MLHQVTLLTLVFSFATATFSSIPSQGLCHAWLGGVLLLSPPHASLPAVHDLPLSSSFCSPPTCYVAQLHLSPALLPFQSLSLLVFSRCHFTSPSISFMPLSSLHCNLNNCFLLFSHLLRWVEWVDGNETAGCQLSVP